MFRVDVFSIAIKQGTFLIIHEIFSISKVLIEFIQILLIICNLIKFGHHRHYHIQSVCPPPIIIVGSWHFIFHHFLGTGYFILCRLTVHVIQVNISLETNLPISKENMFHRFTIIIFPLGFIIRSSSFPLILFSPCCRILLVSLITGYFISCNISGMISSRMPKGKCRFRILRLPIVIYFLNSLNNLWLCPYTIGNCFILIVTLTWFTSCHANTENTA